jgi:outer membrane lipopolysaccharide assembly protein LptE/RlpB
LSDFLLGYWLRLAPQSFLQKTGRFLGAGLLCLALQACGYQFSGSQPLPAGVDTIAVHVVTNRSRQTGLEVAVTNALVNEFIRHRKGMVVNAAQAQGILSGTVLSLETDVTARSSIRQVVQRQVTITLALTLKNRAGEIIWQDNTLSAKRSYRVSDNRLATTANRLRAIDLAVQRLAEDAYKGIVHGI